MDYINDLHEMCETLARDLRKVNERIKAAGNKMTGSDLEYIDKLTHALKSVKAVIQMMESEDEAYSGAYDGRSYRRSYEGGASRRSYEGGSGRGSYRGSYRRDSMGRYAGNDLADRIRELMEEAPDDQSRQELQRLADKMGR